jgi:hypothetical protein
VDQLAVLELLVVIGAVDVIQVTFLEVWALLQHLEAFHHRQKLRSESS